MLPRDIHIIIHFVTCPELLRKQMAQDAGGAVVCVAHFEFFFFFTRKRTSLSAQVAHFRSDLQNVSQTSGTTIRVELAWEFEGCVCSFESYLF